MPVIRSGNPRVTLAVLATVVASFSMLQSLVSPALPVIQHDLHTTPGTVTWVFTALLLSVSVATPLLGYGVWFTVDDAFTSSYLPVLVAGLLLAGVGGLVLARGRDAAPVDAPVRGRRAAR